MLKPSLLTPPRLPPASRPVSRPAGGERRERRERAGLAARTLATIGLLAWLAGCAGYDPAGAPPPARLAPVVAGSGPVVGLALGGGGPRGFAHIGVIEALDDLGVRVGVVAGTSVGALVGGLYAAGYDGGQLRRISDQVGPLDVFDFAPFAQGGFIRGDRLERLVDRLSGSRPIESLPLRFAAVATDRDTRNPVAFVSGPLGRAVRASSAVPGSFVPVRIDGRTYIDGDRSSPVPVLAARQLGADLVIAVDIFGDDNAAQAQQASVALRDHRLQRRLRIDSELQLADIRIRPALGYRMMEVNRAYYEANRRAGYAAVMAMRDTLCARVACLATDALR